MKQPLPIKVYSRPDGTALAECPKGVMGTYRSDMPVEAVTWVRVKRKPIAIEHGLMNAAIRKYQEHAELSV